MARTKGEEASGSRSSWPTTLRRPRTTGSLTPSMAIARSRAAQSELAPTSPRSESPPPSQRGRRRGRAAREHSKSPKRARAAGNSDGENTAASEREEEVEAAAASASPPAEHASSGASSEVSSPLRWPILPRNRIGVDEFGEEILEPLTDPTLVEGYLKLTTKYSTKLDRRLKLVSLERHETETCLVDSKLLPIREHATKIVLQAAKVVLSLSSYINGNLLRRCSGFLIDWDKESKVGTVMTSADVIRSESPSLDEWLGQDQYAPHAEVYAHLLDKADTNIVAELLHYDKHYNIALFKIAIDLSTHIPLFTTELKCAQKVFFAWKK